MPRNRKIAFTEPLEKRTMLFNVGGDWENEDDLAFSYVNVFDGGIQDASGNPLADATIRSAIIEAMSVWAGVVPVKLHQEADSGPNPPADLAYFNFDRKLRFGHHFDDGEPANDDAIGHAWGPDDASSLAGDVHMDNGNDWGTLASGNTADILELLTHEVGHALGMQHEDDLSCIMNENQQGFFSGLGTAFLFQDDINGIQSLYGEGLGYVLTDSDRLFISGTNGNDEITIEYNSTNDNLDIASIGIGGFLIDEDEVLEIVIDSRGGNDTVRVIGLPSDTTCVVNAGSGNDTINVGGEDLNDNIDSDVTVNGGSGTDTLFIRDAGDDGGEYNVNPANISKPNSNVVYYPNGDVESLTVVGTAFNDTFNVLGEGVGTASLAMELQGNDGEDEFNVNFVDMRIDVSVLGGDGHDEITVGFGNFSQNIEGTVDVDGGASGDILTIDDIDDIGPDTYEVNSTLFSKDSGDGEVTFSNVSTFEVEANGSSNTFNVDGVASGTTAILRGRGGDDEFNVSDYDYDSNIIGNLSIDGGAGTGDHIEIRDQNDAGSDPYTLTDETATFGTAFFKEVGGTTFYSAVETMHVQGNNDNNTFNVHGTEFGTRVTLYGLNGNDDFFIGASGDLDPIDDELVIWAGTGNDAVTYDDSLDAPPPVGVFPDTYRITNSSVVKVTGSFPVFEQQFDYFEMEDVIVEGNGDGNTFNVHSTGADVTLRGNDGNDRYNLGLDDNVKDINGTIEADGGAGTDSLYYNDAAATLNRTYTVSPTNLSRTGVAITNPLVNTIVINAGTANDTINVTANIPTTINGGGGNDTINAAGGDWDHLIIAPVAVDGGAGSDHLLIDDQNDGGAENYDLSATTADKSTPFAQPITFTTIESLELAANADANVITVSNTFDGDVEVRGRGGADQFNIIESFAGRSVTVEDGPDLDQVSVNSNGVGTASVVFDSSQDLASLTIGNGGSATLLGDGHLVLNTQSLSMQPNARLDLTDNYMIVDYTGGSPLFNVRSLLTSGYAAGAWNGNGINTSALGAGTTHALGFVEASGNFTTFPATFGGQSVDNTSVLVRYTRIGDADLSGTVDLADFSRVAANFGSTLGFWGRGNFDYDNDVDFADFNLLAGNFGMDAARPGARGPVGLTDAARARWLGEVLNGARSA